jgi:hypothetical protein
MSKAYLIHMCGDADIDGSPGVALFAPGPELLAFIADARRARQELTKDLKERQPFVPGLNAITFFDYTPTYICFEKIDEDAMDAELHALLQAAAWEEHDSVVDITDNQASRIRAACDELKDVYAVCRVNMSILKINADGIIYQMYVKHSDVQASTSILTWDRLGLEP